MNPGESVAIAAIGATNSGLGLSSLAIDAVGGAIGATGTVLYRNIIRLTHGCGCVGVFTAKIEAWGARWIELDREILSDSQIFIDEQRNNSRFWGKRDSRCSGNESNRYTHMLVGLHLPLENTSTLWCESMKKRNSQSQLEDWLGSGMGRAPRSLDQAQMHSTRGKRLPSN